MEKVAGKEREFDRVSHAIDRLFVLLEAKRYGIVNDSLSAFVAAQVRGGGGSERGPGADVCRTGSFVPWATVLPCVCLRVVLCICLCAWLCVCVCQVHFHRHSKDVAESLLPQLPDASLFLAFLSSLSSHRRSNLYVCVLSYACECPNVACRHVCSLEGVIV